MTNQVAIKVGILGDLVYIRIGGYVPILLCVQRWQDDTGRHLVHEIITWSSIVDITSRVCWQFDGVANYLPIQPDDVDAGINEVDRLIQSIKDGLRRTKPGRTFEEGYLNILEVLAELGVTIEGW